MSKQQCKGTTTQRGKQYKTQGKYLSAFIKSIKHIRHLAACRLNNARLQLPPRRGSCPHSKAAAAPECANQVAVNIEEHKEGIFLAAGELAAEGQTCIEAGDQQVANHNPSPFAATQLQHQALALTPLAHRPICRMLPGIQLFLQFKRRRPAPKAQVQSVKIKGQHLHHSSSNLGKAPFG